jgi:hypothetical protein
MKYEYRGLVKYYYQGKNELLREEPVPVSRCAREIYVAFLYSAQDYLYKVCTFTEVKIL